MHLLDLKTVFLAMLATDVACTLLLVQLWRQSRERFAGTGLWALDYALQTAAVPLLLLRGVLPDIVSMVFSNAMILGGAFCGFLGLERFLDRRGPQLHNVFLLILFLILHTWFTIVQPDLQTRNINISIAMFILCAQCAWLMLRRAAPSMRPLTRDVGIVFVLLCVISMFRIARLIAVPTVSQDYFQSSLFESLVPLFYQLLLVFLTYGLSLMLNKRLLMDIGNEEVKLSKVFHCSPDAIVISRLSDGMIVEVNEGFLNTTGYSRAEVLGRTSIDLRMWENREARDAMVGRLFESGSVRGLEGRFRTKSGAVKTGLLSAETIPFAEEKHIITSIIDISERKRAEEERLRLEQQVQQLRKSESLARMAGAIAHNFNNMLGAVTGNLELALHLSPVEPGLKDFIVRAMDASRRAAEISRFMLTYVGQTAARAKPVHLSEVVRESEALLRATIPAHVHLESELPPDGPVIRADGPHIRQIVTNLVNNAVEALGESGGCVGLTVDVVASDRIREPRCFPMDWEPKARRYACLSVRNTGPGIDEATIERMFDPFFTTKSMGRGLGLPVVLGLMRAYEGAVALETRPGEGAVFRAYFPIFESMARPVPEDVPPVSQVAREERLVLVVDDESLLREMARRLLERIFGHRAVTAADGAEAVRILGARGDEIHLVLLDLSMPGMNGWETLSALRSLRPGIPVILASGYDEAQAMAGDHDERPQAFLHKPYGSAELGAALRLALGTHGQPIRSS